MNTQENRDRLAREVKVARLRKFKTVDRARIAAKISRGAWDNVERGDSAKDFTLAAIEEALDWPAGYALSVLDGTDTAPGADRPPGRLADLIEEYAQTDPRITSAWLAEEIGVSRSTVERWRAHAMNELPETDVMHKIAEVTGRSPKDVLYAAGVDAHFIQEKLVEASDDESSTA